MNFTAPAFSTVDPLNPINGSKTKGLGQTKSRRTTEFEGLVEDRTHLALTWFAPSSASSELKRGMDVARSEMFSRGINSARQFNSSVR